MHMTAFPPIMATALTTMSPFGIRSKHAGIGRINDVLSLHHQVETAECSTAGSQ